jgi:hypothetical protein
MEKEITMEKGGARVSVPENRAGALSRRGWKEVKATADKPAKAAVVAEKEG